MRDSARQIVASPPSSSREEPAGWLPTISLALKLAASATIAKILRFGFIGTLSSTVYAVVTASLAYTGLMQPTAATLVGYLAAIPLNFVGHRSYTFRATFGDIKPQFIRFLVTTAVNLALSFAIMSAAINWFGIGAVGGILLTILTIPLVTFLVLDRWVFRTVLRPPPT